MAAVGIAEAYRCNGGVSSGGKPAHSDSVANGWSCDPWRARRRALRPVIDNYQRGSIRWSNHRHEPHGPTRSRNRRASAGIGRAIATAFVDEGARVILNARNIDKLAALQAELGADRTFVVAGDVAGGPSAQALAAAVDAIGPLEVLINNVGIFGVKPFAEITDQEWLRFYDVNVVGNVRLIRHFLPGMLERNFGRNVNISSECGVRGFGDMAHYATTKAA